MYKCIRDFKAKDGRPFYYGNRIHLFEYNKLTPHERGRFVLEKQEEEEEKPRDSSIDNSWMTYLGSTHTSYDPPTDGQGYETPDTGSASSNNVDYGGGESGGGGSSGEY